MINKLLGRLLVLVAFLVCAQASAATRASLQQYNNAYIIANGRGLITGPILNNMNSQFINGMGVLGDTNAWTGTNTFTQINNLIYVTGTTSSAVAAAEAAAVTAGVGLAFGPQAYDASGVTFTTPVVFQPGALLNCATSQFSFSNSVSAARNKIFGTGCTPTFSASVRQSEEYPEWWGAIGDSNGNPGSGTDNTAALNNAIASGARNVTGAAGANYRFSSISTTASNFRFGCPSRDSTILTQDDASGLLDGIFLRGHSGAIQIDHCTLQRAQPAIASVISAEVVGGGGGCSVGNTISVTGGSYTTQAILTVATVSGSAAATLTVTTAGSYTKSPPKNQTPLVTPAVATAAVAGSCTGVTVKLLMTDPGMVHVQDAFYVDITDNRLASSNAWNQVSIDSTTFQPNQIHVDNNQIFNQENDGVYAYAATSAGAIADIFIEKANYMELAGNAAVELRGYVGGVFENGDVIFDNGYDNYWDADGASGGISSSKIRFNDIDSNTSGEYFNDVGTTEFEDNWHSDTGTLVCTLCSVVDIKGGLWPSTGGMVFNGSQSIQIDTMFGGQAAPVTLNAYNGTHNTYFDIRVLWAFGSGFLLTANDTSADRFTLSGQINPNVGLLTGNAIGHIQNFILDPSNNSDAITSSILWGQSNLMANQNSGVGGYNNNVNCYSCWVTGQYNNATGSYSTLHGLQAGDDGLYGANCFTSGSPASASGVGGSSYTQECLHTLWGTSVSTGTIRLTSDGLAVGSADCINLPNASSMTFWVQANAIDRTTPGNSAAWSSTGANLLTRGANAASTTYSGAFGTATAAQASAGSGSTATLQLSADTTNGCLNATGVSPNSDRWDWVVVVYRAKTL